MRRMSKQFIDIGANLMDGMYQGKYHGNKVPKHPPDLNHVLNRAWSMGMTHLIITAGNLSESQKALNFVKNDERLFCTIGVHPTRCNEFDDEKYGSTDDYLNELIKIAKHGAKIGKIVAVGECGLDYDRLHFCDKETQLKHFDKHFKIVEQTGLPMFLHNRASTKDLYHKLKNNRNRWNKAVIHSFSDSVDDMKLLLTLKGIYIGINGCSLKTEENLKMVKEIPLDRLMIETDAPWCGIKKSHAGYKYIKTRYPEVSNKKHSMDNCVKGRSEPCHIIQVLEVIAFVKSIDVDKLCNIIYNNTLNVFFSKQSNEIDEWMEWLIKQHESS